MGMAKTIVSELYFIVDSTCIRMGMIKLDFSLGLLLLLLFFFRKMGSPYAHDLKSVLS